MLVVHSLTCAACHCTLAKGDGMCAPEEEDKEEEPDGEEEGEGEGEGEGEREDAKDRKCMRRRRLFPSARKVSMRFTRRGGEEENDDNDDDHKDNDDPFLIKSWSACVVSFIFSSIPSPPSIRHLSCFFFLSSPSSSSSFAMRHISSTTESERKARDSNGESRSIGIPLIYARV
jgi:hypothetical protein